MLNYKNFRPSDDIYWLLNLACLKHTGMMLPDAYAENTNWTKDEDGKSKLLLKPQLLQPSCFNDLSLQIKRSMIVDDLNVLFKGRDAFKDGCNEGDIKRTHLNKFANSGRLTDLSCNFSSNLCDFQLPKQRIGIHQHNERISEYSFRSSSNWDNTDFGNYVMRILFETDLTREDILKVIEAFKIFHDWKPTGNQPKWKQKTCPIDYNGHRRSRHTSLIELVWIRGKSPVECMTPSATNKNINYKRGWESFKDDDTRPEFFYKRIGNPKVKKNASVAVVSEWFFQQFYLIHNNRTPHYNYITNHGTYTRLHKYGEFDVKTRTAIREGWGHVKNKSNIDIEDEFRIFALPEYKIKPRTYDSVVNSIAW